MSAAATETTTRPLTVLVTGATGKVGRRLVRYLLDDGHLVRHPHGAEPPSYRLAPLPPNLPG